MMATPGASPGSVTNASLPNHSASASVSATTGTIDPNNNSISYTIFVRGQPFRLSRNQIQFDSPNYFQSALFGEFYESQSRSLHLDCRPDLFSLILDYLSGYHILPLRKESCPVGMTLEQMKRNLLHDAKYLQLSRLERALNAEDTNFATDITAQIRREGLNEMMGLPDMTTVLMVKNVGISFWWHKRQRPSSYYTETEHSVQVYLREEHYHSICSHLAGSIAPTVDRIAKAKIDFNHPHRPITVTFADDVSHTFTLQEYGSEQKTPLQDPEWKEKLKVARRKVEEDVFLDITAKKACLAFHQVPLQGVVPDSNGQVPMSWRLVDVLAVDGEPPRQRMSAILRDK